MMARTAKKALSVFSPEETERLQGIYTGKGLSPKDIEEAKKALRACLVAMSEYRHNCIVHKGSEFVIKGGMCMKIINESRAKLEDLKVMEDRDFNWLTLLIFNKSQVLRHQVIEEAVRRIIIV
jgi:hypothetical protein